MELSRKRVKFWSGATGVAGALLIACMACCLPLMAPVLAWLGVAGLALMGPYGLLAAALAAAAIVSVMLMRRRRRSQCQGVKSGATSACQAGCTAPQKVVEEAIVAPSLPAPIACTLSTNDFKERALWLNELKARSLLSHRFAGLSVHLSYRLDAADDVEKMVRQEQACCSFLHFDLRRSGTAMELTVTAPAEAAADAKILFAHLVPE